MISFVVHSIELVLLGLVGHLSHTVLTLFNNEGILNRNTQTSARPYSRVESIASAQIFTGLQLLDVKRKGINPFASGEDWLDSGISFYLMGAACAITEHFACNDDDKGDVIKFLLTRNLKLTEEKAERYLTHLNQVDEQTIEQSAFSAGIDAAKTWLRDKFIPEEQSLLNNLHTWGFVA